MELNRTQIENLANSLVSSHDELLEKLIALREKHSLSQTEIADRMGVSQPTISAFERYDSNPTLSTIRRYALAVGASITHVVKDECVEHSVENVRDVVLGPTGSWAESILPLDWDWAQPAASMASNA